jgi:hypothetical protein
VTKLPAAGHVIGGAGEFHGGGGEPRQERGLGRRVVVGMPPPAEVEDWREQRHAVEAYAVVGLERLGENGGRGAAAAFADEGFGEARRPDWVWLRVMKSASASMPPSIER